MKVIEAAIVQGRLDPTITEATVVAHTIGPIHCARLFHRHETAESDRARTVDAFLAAFAP
ncbi:MAG: hypothetical protein GY708_20255 [Actinomycetia bacterium]|nr:hypothetical protein [Actinomycetes bacterium]MCP4963064.1 hypothetical protein [Actinomycetes bacterium]